MATKYQIFISSTYEDLKIERERVTRAVLEMGHIPVGMEMFSAADETQWQIITRHIDESDYYVVIIAHRYGSIADGISYTRKEYQYAVSKGIPVLGFIIDDTAPWPAGAIETSEEARGSLEDFKALARTKPVDSWSTASDLYGKCVVALMKAFTTQPREGWVRASTTAGPEIVAEISRLSAENARLRQNAANAVAAANASRLAKKEEVKRILRTRKLKVPYRYSRGDTSWQDDSPEVSLLELFVMLAPSMQVEYEVNEAARLVALHIRQDSERSTDIIPINHMKQIFAELRAHEIAQPSTRKHSVTDKGEYWTLTDRGQELLDEALRSEVLRDEGSVDDVRQGVPDQASAMRSPAKKSPAKKSPAKKSPTKKSPTKKSPTKKP